MSCECDCNPGSTLFDSPLRPSLDALGAGLTFHNGWRVLFAISIPPGELVYYLTPEKSELN